MEHKGHKLQSHDKLRHIDNKLPHQVYVMENMLRNKETDLS